MQNTRLDESQAGIKIAGRNISNLRYADGTTLMAEIEDELRSFLMRVKEVKWSHSVVSDKLESRLPGDISTTSNMQMVPI